MRIYPAIHISDGRCINELPDGITRGHVWTPQPLEMARKWQDQGAECLHVVDLDGADSGTSVNGTVIREILENVHIPVQVGGGIRMNIGVHRVVIGTQAIENPVLIREAVHLFGSDKILVSIDAKDGLIATEGRKKFSHYNAMAVASNMKAMGIESVIYTDILRRGLYNGAGIMQAREIAQKLHMKVIYSGGIVTLKDIEAFTDMPMEGVIIGRALYESRLKLSEAIEVCRGHECSI